jgi:hypothetical protein
MKPLASALSEVEKGLRGEDGGGDRTNIHVSLFGIVTMSSPVQQMYPNKNKKIKKISHNTLLYRR